MKKLTVLAAVALFLAAAPSAQAWGCNSVAISRVVQVNRVQVQRVIQVQRVQQIVAVERVRVAAIALPFVQVTEFRAAVPFTYGYAAGGDTQRLERQIAGLADTVGQLVELQRQQLKAPK